MAGEGAQFHPAANVDARKLLKGLAHQSGRFPNLAHECGMTFAHISAATICRRIGAWSLAFLSHLFPCSAKCLSNSASPNGAMNAWASNRPSEIDPLEGGSAITVIRVYQRLGR